MVTYVSTLVSRARSESGSSSKAAGFPTAEFTQPICIIAVCITALNDHLLKRAGVLPPFITGKLSDLFGLLFFPLFLTAFVDTVLYIARSSARRFGVEVPVSHHLTKAKLLISCAATGLSFSALKLFEPAREFYIAALGRLGLRVLVTLDPTDLVALLMLPLAYLLGRRFVVGESPGRPRM